MFQCLFLNLFSPADYVRKIQFGKTEKLNEQQGNDLAVFFKLLINIRIKSMEQLFEIALFEKIFKRQFYNRALQCYVHDTKNLPKWLDINSLAS